MAAGGFQPNSIQATPRLTQQRPRDSQDAEQEATFLRLMESTETNPHEEQRMLVDRAGMSDQKAASVTCVPQGSLLEALRGPLKTDFWKYAAVGMGGSMGGGMGAGGAMDRGGRMTLSTQMGSMGAAGGMTGGRTGQPLAAPSQMRPQQQRAMQPQQQTPSMLQGPLSRMRSGAAPAMGGGAAGVPTAVGAVRGPIPAMGGGAAPAMGGRPTAGTRMGTRGGGMMGGQQGGGAGSLGNRDPGFYGPMSGGTATPRGMGMTVTAADRLAAGLGWSSVFVRP